MTLNELPVGKAAVITKVGGAGALRCRLLDMGLTPRTKVMVRKVAPMYTRLQSIMDRLNQVVQENLTAIRAVKAFVRDEYEEDKFEEVNRDMAKSSETTFHYAVLNLPAFQGIMYTTIVMILRFGGNMILKSELAVGNLTGFLSYKIFRRKPRHI